MKWVKLAVDFADDPKVRGISDAAFRVHVEVICWVGEHETDGRVVGRYPEDVVDELVKAGLWDRTEQGLVVHAWDRWQRTHDFMEARRASARNALSNRWSDRGSNGESDGESNRESDRESDTVSNRISEAAPKTYTESNTPSDTGSNTPSDTESNTESNTEVSTKNLRSKNLRSKQDLTTSEVAKEPPPEARALAEALATSLVANGVKIPANLDRWAESAERMLRIDERDLVQTRKLIRFAGQDPFWRSVVHSMDSLRSNYDKLRLAQERANAQPKTTGGDLPMMERD